MPARRRTARRRRPAASAEVPEHLLDPGGRVPSGDRLTALLAFLAEADPGSRWHDPLALLTASGEALADVLTPAPPLRPSDRITLEGEPSA